MLMYTIELDLTNSMGGNRHRKSFSEYFRFLLTEEDSVDRKVFMRLQRKTEPSTRNQA